MRRYSRFIGVDLGGGKGKTTAVAQLELDEERGGVRVVDFGTGREGPWYDTRLLAYLRDQPDSTAVGIDAPLTLPSGILGTNEKIREWFRARAGEAKPAHKPKYTPYTQRATEVLLHEEREILPRETLGQGMGPLTARALYLVRELDPRFKLERDLIEVYPKATIAALFPGRLERLYKRAVGAGPARLAILNGLTDLTFAPGQWREHALAHDHKFDAILCAYTTYLWSRQACVPPPDETVASDGWIWVPTTQK